MSEVTIPNKPKLNPLFRLQYEQAQKAYVLLYPEGMVKLNQAASEILLQCTGEQTLNDIVASLEEKFGTTGLVGDVTSMLEEATRRNWLEDAA